jgi:putative ABC transport system permease protein
VKLSVEIKEGLRISWECIRANKLRSCLTTLGVVIGIVTITLMGTAIQGVNRSFQMAVSQMGSDVLYVTRFSPFGNEEWWKVRNRKELTFAHAAAIQRQSEFAADVVTESDMMLTVRRENTVANNVPVLGVESTGLNVRGFMIEEGRGFTEAEVAGARPVVVLGKDVAEKFFPREPPLNKRIKLNGQTFEVVGVMAPLNKFMGLGNDNHLVIPITYLVNGFGSTPELRFLVKVRDVSRLDDAREELRGILRTARRVEPGDDDDFGITGQDMILNMFQRVGGTIAGIGLFITGLSLFVGGIGIMNIMFVSVAERTQEIGIRKAIGARRRTILFQFLVEAAMLCLLGGFIGLGIAFPVVLLMQTKFPAALSVEVVGLALGLATLTGLIAGFMPAWRAARMNPVDALRSE